ncbi:phosphomannomutase [Malassezia obtusa]|uniref:Phosphomannomutase n=1 Tax=Malassezia obtusa TaxID=76774 RepID=A0AAF0E4C4_9BASI|nr:phosphomannomutase [Malassezia obtusa]
MYNGIGLQTARGSGTNGYVQRNLSSIRPRDAPQAPPQEKARILEPDQKILDHDRKRKVEIQCIELQDELEEQGLRPSDTHALGAAKRLESEKMERALRIRPDYREGEAFQPEVQEQRKIERMEERARRQEESRERWEKRREERDVGRDSYGWRRERREAQYERRGRRDLDDPRDVRERRSYPTFPDMVVPLAQRKNPGVICLFDVDGTLTPARQSVSKEMLDVLKKLREHTATGFVGGSDLNKIREQLQLPGAEDFLEDFDYGFAENGLTAYRMGKELPSESFINWLGEEKYKKLVKFVLGYISKLDIPVMRGTFVEFRRGMINERLDFQEYDKQHNIRRDFVETLKKEFPDYGLTYSIGGQISFDVFPDGWDKTFALQHVKETDDVLPGGYKEIHFFGDKTFKGGNDYEIFTHPKVIGHTVTSPEDTIKQLQELFLH